MPNAGFFHRTALLAFAMLLPAAAAANAPATLRVDVMHTGTASSESY